MIQERIDRDRAIESVKKLSLALTPTTELRRDMYSDLLQVIANAEGEPVRLLLAGNIIFSREPAAQRSKAG